MFNTVAMRCAYSAWCPSAIAVHDRAVWLSALAVATEDHRHLVESAPNSFLDGHVHRLYDLAREPPHLDHQSLEKHGLDPRVISAQLVEQCAVDGDRFNRVERSRRGVARSRRYDRELAEELARSDDPHRGDVAERRMNPQRDMAPRNEVQRVAGIALVEQHFLLCEPAAPSAGEQLPAIRFGQRVEQRPIHGYCLAACR